ncbi:MAG: hypothetical protein ABR874_02225 [Candidatus Sulfotelmatobacter sp.]|jgi:hypothetical protein
MVNPISSAVSSHATETANASAPAPKAQQQQQSSPLPSDTVKLSSTGNADQNEGNQ